MKVIAAALAAAVFASGTVRATLSAPGHTPKVKTKWYYVLRVTKDGRPATARVTAQIVDPIGGVHPVQVGATKKNITNFPIKGSFRDYIIWPVSSRDVPLTLRFTIKVGTTKRVVKYRVVPHG
jgi:hypothetical protein